MLSGEPVVADKEAIPFVDETIGDWKQNVLIQPGGIPLQQHLLLHEGLTKLKEPVPSALENFFKGVIAPQTQCIVIDHSEPLFPSALRPNIVNGLPCSNTTVDEGLKSHQSLRGFNLSVR